MLRTAPARTPIYVTAADGFLRDLPKIQLHCHLEGTLRPATFVDLARRHGVALTYRPHGPEQPFQKGAPAHADEDPYGFRDFNEFLLTFAAVSRSLAEPDDYARLATEYVQDAAAQNVVYAELFISPSVWRFFHPGIDVRACVEAMRDAFEKATKPFDISFIVDVTRNFGVESAFRTLRMAGQMRDLGVIGIGLGGDEARFPAELFADVFAQARAAGLHVVAHAGEAAGAESIRQAVELLKAERIGHGILALQDASTVALLADKKIPLEICPTSNFLTGAADPNYPHPLIGLDTAGCIVTIDADDPALFRTSITSEYGYVQRVAGRESLLRFVRNAVDASFAGERRKAALHVLLERYG